MTGRRAADAASAFGRLSTATTPQPPDAVATQPPDAVAPRSHDVSSRVIRKFAVRLYDPAEDDALNRLRRDLRNLLGRTPSASETAAAALVVADADPVFREAVAEQIRRHPRREP